MRGDFWDTLCLSKMINIQKKNNNKKKIHTYVNVQIQRSSIFWCFNTFPSSEKKCTKFKYSEAGETVLPCPASQNPIHLSLEFCSKVDMVLPSGVHSHQLQPKKKKKHAITIHRNKQFK